MDDEHDAEETPDEVPADEVTVEDAPDPDKEWTAAGEEIRSLGAHFKRHYDEPTDGEPGPSSDELKDAARAFGRSFGRFVSAIGEAARDPEVKESARRAGSRVLDAFGQTFSQLGKEAKDAFESEGDDDAVEAATRELDDADLLDELKADLAEDEGEPTA